MKQTSLCMKKYLLNRKKTILRVQHLIGFGNATGTRIDAFQQDWSRWTISSIVTSFSRAARKSGLIDSGARVDQPNTAIIPAFICPVIEEIDRSLL